MSFKAVGRENGGVMVLDLDGRITLGDGSQVLRDLVRKQLTDGHLKILVNLSGIAYMDSSGLGELVSGLRAVRSQGGDLKLLSPSKKISDLLQITKLYGVFDIHKDESQAVASFRV
jgi:anti-sigma B factor antagonist